jgi:hypothetical protein
MRTLFLAFILLHSLSVLSSEGVNVEQPMMTLAPTNDRLREWCGAGGTYDACTRFVAYRLEASCVAGADDWRIEVTARFRPWILIRNPESIPHEHEHVGDVRRSAEVFVFGLRSLRFESAAACEAKALSEAASFGDAMRGWALQSNLERHPILRRARR